MLIVVHAALLGGARAERAGFKPVGCLLARLCVVAPGRAASRSLGTGTRQVRPHRQAGPGHHARGQDHHAKVQIELEDAYTGATRAITLQTPEVDEQGRVHLRKHTLNVTIPRGIRAGQHIRLAGQGMPGLGQGGAGDLYLEIEFRPHPHYRVEQRDVYFDLRVAPWEAALGAAVEVPVPNGTVELKVPAGATAGQKLRLKGRGIPGSTPGDFYAVLQIALPPADTDAGRMFYNKMAEQFKSFNPRATPGV